MEHIRLPRFRRSNKIAQIQLTERDCEILKLLHRHRFLRSDHFTSLLPGSRQQLLRRLQLLYHHGYLERPRCQIDYYHRSGSRCIAYGLENKGAQLLKKKFALASHRQDWNWKNRVTRFFLEHALLVSDVMAAVESACRKQPAIKLILPDEPFRWKVSLSRGSKIGVVPDSAFGLEREGKQSWFLLEADRGTMPIQRGDLRQSSFRRKLLAYEATWTQNIHRTDLNIHRFRVLTVTSNAARLASMREACRSLNRGHGLFLFTDAKALRAQSEFFTHRWHTIRDNEPAGLLD